MATQSASSTSPARHHPTLDNGLRNQEYSLVATQEWGQFRNLYGIGVCGANLDDVLFELGAQDTFFTFSLPENVRLAREEAHRLMSLQPSTSGSWNCYPSANFGVIARAGDKPPVLFFGLCDCPSCKRSTDVDPFNLSSIRVNLLLNFGGSPVPVKGFSFHPTSKEEYNMGLPLARNLKNVLYYTNEWTRHSTLRDFIAHLGSIRVPEGNEVADITTTIKFKHFTEALADPDQNKKALRLMQQDDAFADFELISSYDGKKYKCHKIVLSVQSEELKRIVLRKQAEEEPLEARNTLTLTEDRKTIWAFLQWIYYKSESLIPSSFEKASGLLRLAHEYHLPTLVAAAAQVLKQMIKKGDSNSTALWKLYKFVRLVDKIDVVVQLKMEIVKKLAKNLVTKKLEKVRATATEEMKALNDGQPVDPDIANDFILDVVDLGKFDE